MAAGGALTVVNGIYGNPVSAWRATVRIRRYVADVYPESDLEVSRAQYNFKISAYASRVSSPLSEDTRFSVSWNGERMTDSYESDVAGRMTTYRRLCDELDRLAEAALSADFPYEITLALADLTREEDLSSALTPDMVLDPAHPPLGAALTVWTVSETLSYEVMAARLTELRRVMEDHGISVAAYTLRLEAPVSGEEKPGSGGLLYLMDFPAEAMDAPDLAEALEAHQRQWEQERAKDTE